MIQIAQENLKKQISVAFSGIITSFSKVNPQEKEL
jgi:hypothetical protein